LFNFAVLLKDLLFNFLIRIFYIVGLQAITFKIDYNEIKGTERRFRVQVVDILSKKNENSAAVELKLNSVRSK
jgi:hypothetical protein